MKLLSILTLSLAAILSVSAVAATEDADNTKLRLTLRSDPTSDCKISRRELSRHDGVTPGRRYTCTQLGELGELTLTDFTNLVKANDLTIEYGGNSEESLLQTLADWRENLIKSNNRQTHTPEVRIAEITPWSFRLVSRAENSAVIEFANASTNETINVEFTMNVVIVTKNK
ncbi:MAG: hypothetical protein EOP11_02465 [Proteobacteria bacterium]|nr:MAG: hypothetical protein EOP11_02465 [Pseudomonadota bacterium]